MFPSIATVITAFSSFLLVPTAGNPARDSEIVGAVSGGGDEQKPFPSPPNNDGIHLAVPPHCGQLFGVTADINAGVDHTKLKTIVSFGDSYTDGGKSDGSPLDPPILVPPNPLASGRSTNGLTWVEHVANDIGAVIMDYAQAGACTSLVLWPSNPRKVDFRGQVQTYLNQHHSLNPNTTLYSIFFGINDYLASLVDGDRMPEAAQILLDQVKILASPPTNARNFMILDVYGRGTTAPPGEVFKQMIFTAISGFYKDGVVIGANSEPTKLNVSFVNFANIWNGVLGDSPGFKAFGYTSIDACIRCTAELGCTTIGRCNDPNHYFYWFPGHPSKQTNRIMADYVAEVWNQCRA